MASLAAVYHWCPKDMYDFTYDDFIFWIDQAKQLVKEKS
jgi:hypothetical protein